jgi:hypothetical protein
MWRVYGVVQSEHQALDEPRYQTCVVFGRLLSVPNLESKRCHTYKQHLSGRQVKPYSSVTCQVFGKGRLQIILLLFTEIFQLCVPLNHSSHGNTYILDFSTSSFNESPEPRTVRISSVSSVGYIEYGQGRVRLSSSRVVSCLSAQFLEGLAGRTKEIGEFIIGDISVSFPLHISFLSTEEERLTT